MAGAASGRPPQPGQCSSGGPAERAPAAARASRPHTGAPRAQLVRGVSQWAVCGVRVVSTTRDLLHSSATLSKNLRKHEEQPSKLRGLREALTVWGWGRWGTVTIRTSGPEGTGGWNIFSSPYSTFVCSAGDKDKGRLKSLLNFGRKKEESDSSSDSVRTRSGSMTAGNTTPSPVFLGFLSLGFPLQTRQ